MKSISRTRTGWHPIPITEFKRLAHQDCHPERSEGSRSEILRCAAQKQNSPTPSSPWIPARAGMTELWFLLSCLAPALWTTQNDTPERLCCKVYQCPEFWFSRRNCGHCISTQILSHALSPSQCGLPRPLKSFSNSSAVCCTMRLMSGLGIPVCFLMSCPISVSGSAMSLGFTRTRRRSCSIAA